MSEALDSTAWSLLWPASASSCGVSAVAPSMPGPKDISVEGPASAVLSIDDNRDTNAARKSKGVPIVAL